MDRPIYDIVTNDLLGYARDVESHDVADLPDELVRHLQEMSYPPPPVIPPELEHRREVLEVAVALVRKVYEFHGAGGCLHNVIDDDNIADHNLDFCRAWIHQAYVTGETSVEQWRAEVACHDALRSLTMPERALVLSLRNGYWVLTAEEIKEMESE